MQPDAHVERASRGADGLAGRDLVACAHDETIKSTVGDQQPLAHLDHHPARARHTTGERNATRSGCAHLLTHRRSPLDAAIPGAPLARRLTVGVDDLAPDGKHEPAPNCRNERGERRHLRDVGGAEARAQQEDRLRVDL